MSICDLAGRSPKHNHPIRRGNRFGPMRDNHARHVELLDGVNEASPQQAAGYHKEGHCL